jgi:pyridoxine 5'-phosphate synthase PdxJ
VSCAKNAGNKCLAVHTRECNRHVDAGSPQIVLLKLIRIKHPIEAPLRKQLYPGLQAILKLSKVQINFGISGSSIKLKISPPWIWSDLIPSFFAS